MAAALRLLGARVVVIVHDATLHPGDGFPGQMQLQRLLCRMANGLAVLCDHVGDRLRQQMPATTLLQFRHPPFGFDLPPVVRKEGLPRLLCFGRLLPYKGLDLLADALASLPHRVDVRVVGSGPETASLQALRASPGVSVENRWVAETEIGALLAWSDALILPYREASQSGVAAAAMAAGRPVIATRVGGLQEQLAGASGARLCEPTADSIAQAIGLWLAAPYTRTPPLNAALAWREAASGLLTAIATALPPARRTKRVVEMPRPPLRRRGPDPALPRAASSNMILTDT
jgi:glycosyltransferase involved in cell wall biosynthesis